MLARTVAVLLIAVCGITCAPSINYNSHNDQEELDRLDLQEYCHNWNTIRKQVNKVTSRDNNEKPQHMSSGSFESLIMTDIVGRRKKREIEQGKDRLRKDLDYNIEDYEEGFDAQDDYYNERYITVPVKHDKPHQRHKSGRGETIQEISTHRPKPKIALRRFSPTTKNPATQKPNWENVRRLYNRPSGRKVARPPFKPTTPKIKTTTTKTTTAEPYYEYDSETEYDDSDLLINNEDLENDEMIFSAPEEKQVDKTRVRSRRSQPTSSSIKESFSVSSGENDETTTEIGEEQTENSLPTTYNPITESKRPKQPTEVPSTSTTAPTRTRFPARKANARKIDTEITNKQESDTPRTRGRYRPRTRNTKQDKTETVRSTTTNIYEYTDEEVLVPSTTKKPKPNLIDEEFKKQAESAHYKFGSSIDDSISGTKNEREEERDGVNVKGKYSYSDGFYQITVHYVADDKGYRIIKQEKIPIGNGPEYNPDGYAHVSSYKDNKGSEYKISESDIQKKKNRRISLNIRRENPQQPVTESQSEPEEQVPEKRSYEAHRRVYPKRPLTRQRGLAERKVIPLTDESSSEDARAVTKTTRQNPQQNLKRDRTTPLARPTEKAAEKGSTTDYTPQDEDNRKQNPRPQQTRQRGFAERKVVPLPEENTDEDARAMTKTTRQSPQENLETDRTTPQENQAVNNSDNKGMEYQEDSQKKDSITAESQEKYENSKEVIKGITRNIPKQENQINSREDQKERGNDKTEISSKTPQPESSINNNQRNSDEKKDSKKNPKGDEEIFPEKPNQVNEKSTQKPKDQKESSSSESSETSTSSSQDGKLSPSENRRNSSTPVAPSEKPNQVNEKSTQKPKDQKESASSESSETSTSSSHDGKSSLSESERNSSTLAPSEKPNRVNEKSTQKPKDQKESGSSESSETSTSSSHDGKSSLSESKRNSSTLAPSEKPNQVNEKSTQKPKDQKESSSSESSETSTSSSHDGKSSPSESNRNSSTTVTPSENHENYEEKSETSKASDKDDDQNSHKQSTSETIKEAEGQ